MATCVYVVACTSFPVSVARADVATFKQSTCTVSSSSWSPKRVSHPSPKSATCQLASSCHVAQGERGIARLSSQGRQIRQTNRAASTQWRCASTEEVETEKELIETDALERMEKTLESVKSNFNTVRTGRASPSLLDRIEVEYYGSPVTLRSIAQVTAPDGSTILISPFDRSSLGSIEKSILKSDVGITPSNDGSVIRLSIPQLTAERRKELLKLVSRLTEDGKVALRNVRRDAIKAYEKLEKEKKLSEDNVKDLSNDIQKLTDEYVKKVETMFKTKEKDLTTV